jgi:asparagine synthase (glutamine-hydrolysing)
VKYGIDKDQNAGKISNFHFSDGLDCRTTVYAAESLGCKEKLILNYASTGSTDYVYPQKLIKTVSGKLLQMPIDGTFLTRNWDEWFNATGGLIHFSPGGLPLLDLMPMIDWSRYGLNHNGYAGDAIVGTFHKNGVSEPVQHRSGAMSQLLFDRIDVQCVELTKHYPNMEIFKMYSRAANGASQGPMLHRQYTFSNSPFLDPDFFDFALSVPPKIRASQRLRLDLIKRYYPFGAHGPWGATKLSVSTSLLLAKFLPIKYLTLPARLHRAFQQYVLRNASYSLIPIDYWYRTNEKISHFFNTMFMNHIDVLSPSPELRKDCELLFDSKDETVPRYRRAEQQVYNKILCLSLLYALRKYF